MSITKYQIFVKVAELGSLTRAAEALGYTQPAVSHSISSLESRFGFPLFYRSRDACRLKRLLNGLALLCRNAPPLRHQCDLILLHSVSSPSSIRRMASAASNAVSV